METFEIRFQPQKLIEFDDLTSKASDLLAVWMKNGQIKRGSWPAATWGRRGYRTFVSCPETTSLDEKFDNGYGKAAREELLKQEIRLTIHHIGPDPDTATTCECPRPSWCLLWTNYLCQETPMRCGDCFGVLPLYRFPASYHGEFCDILWWESAFQNCDELQMHCRVGERFGTREISRADSSLSKSGRTICQEWTERTGIPTYYYLYRYGGRSLATEQSRPCPGCGGAWLLPECIHGFLDMKCDACRLVSNITWNCR